jgi:hypothetical protein
MIRVCRGGRQSVLEDPRPLRSWGLIQFIEQPFCQPHPVYPTARNTMARRSLKMGMGREMSAMARMVFAVSWMCLGLVLFVK